MPVPFERTLNPCEGFCYKLLVEREEARQRRGEVEVVVEPDDAAVDGDALGVLQLDLETAAEVEPVDDERALPFDAEDRGAVVDGRARVVAAPWAAAAERPAGAYGLCRNDSAVLSILRAEE